MTLFWKWKAECLKARAERDAAVAKNEQAEKDLVFAARARAEASQLYENAKASLAAVESASVELKAADARMADVNAAIRQQNYKMRMVLESALKRSLPAEEVERIRAVLGEPRPGTEMAS